MNEVVLIRCLAEWMDLSCPFAVVLIPGGVRFLSLFFDFFLVAILGGYWVPKGPQNRPKIDSLREKCPKERAFKAVFAWRAASPHFFKLFLVFFGQKTMKKSSCSCTSCWCFPPLKNHAFYRLPCLGTVFLEIC